MQTIQHGYVKQSIRQALQEVVGTEPIADVIGPKKAEVVNKTQARISERLAPYGIVVKQFTINELRAPPAVIDAINTKNVMQQQALTAQNELQKNQFQAQGDSIKAAGRAKAILAEAEAQAKANRLLSAESDGDTRAVRDGETVERADAAGVRQRDADDSAPWDVEAVVTG